MANLIADEILAHQGASQTQLMAVAMLHIMYRSYECRCLSSLSDYLKGFRLAIFVLIVPTFPFPTFIIFSHLFFAFDSTGLSGGAWMSLVNLRLGQGEGVFKMQAKKVVLGSGRLRAGSIIAEEEPWGADSSYRW